MTDDPGTDLLIIGDSHSAAIKAGCDAVGLRNEMLLLSGNIWHERLVSLHPEHGIWVRGKAWQQRILDIRARIGGRSLLSPELPVIASIGFHLGRIVPPFGFRGHVTGAAEFDADPDSLFASRAVVEAYARHWRLAHVRLLRRMSRLAPLVAVMPPNVYPLPNYPAFLDVMAAMIRAAGVTLYDPREDIGTRGKLLSRSYLGEDGVHGNARYGRELVEAMARRGMIPGITEA